MWRTHDVAVWLKGNMFTGVREGLSKPADFLVRRSTRVKYTSISAVRCDTLRSLLLVFWMTQPGSTYMIKMIYRNFILTFTKRSDTPLEELLPGD